MNGTLRNRIALGCKLLSIGALVGTVAMTVKINVQGERFKQTVKSEQAFRNCHERVLKSGLSYMTADFSSQSTSNNFLQGSTNCLTESNKELSKIAGVSPSLITAMKKYSNNVSQLNDLILDQKSKRVFLAIKDRFSKVKNTFAQGMAEMSKTQNHLAETSSFIKNKNYLISIFTLFASLIGILIFGRGRSGVTSSIFREVEDEAKKIMEGSKESDTAVRELFSKIAKSEDMNNFNELIQKFADHKVSKNDVVSKFDEAEKALQEEEELSTLLEDDQLEDISIKLSLVEEKLNKIKNEANLSEDSVGKLKEELSDVIANVDLKRTEESQEYYDSSMRMVGKKIEQLQKLIVKLEKKEINTVNSRVMNISDQLNAVGESVKNLGKSSEKMSGLGVSVANICNQLSALNSKLSILEEEAKQKDDYERTNEKRLKAIYKQLSMITGQLDDVDIFEVKDIPAQGEGAQLVNPMPENKTAMAAKDQQQKVIDKLNNKLSENRDRRSGQHISKEIVKLNQKQFPKSHGLYDLERCVVDSVNELSSLYFAGSVSLDVNIDSEIMLGKSALHIKSIVTSLLKESIENNKGIKGPKQLSINSKVIGDNVLLEVTNKVVGRKMNYDSLKLSAKKIHFFDSDGSAKQCDERLFTDLADMEGHKIGNRYNFCIPLKMSRSSLPDYPKVLHN